MEFRTSCRRSVKLDAFLVGSGRDHRCADDDQASGGEYCPDMLHTSPPCRTGARIYRWGRIVNPVTGRELTQSVSTDRAYFTYATTARSSTHENGERLAATGVPSRPWFVDSS